MKAKMIAFVFAASLSGAALADCDEPAKPAIPDGTSASAADMFKAKKEVDAFIKASESYLESCRVSDRRHNIMVAEMQKVASEFNENLRVYKDRA